MPGKQFAVFTPDIVAKVMESLTANSVPLSTVTGVKAALQAYEAGKGVPPQTARDVRDHVFDRTHKDSPSTQKYLEGSDVRRYQVSWSGSWLSYGPWISQPRELSTFSEPRVLVREVTGRFPKMLIAAPVDGLYLNNKSIVNVMCNVNRHYDLYVVAGILNSKLGSFIFKHSGVKANRGLFPKVVIGDLQQFPVPGKPNADVLGRIRNAVREMCAEVARKSKEDSDLQVKIDRLVCSLYGLTPDEVEIVESEAEVSEHAAD